jgi:hypothetical protein
MSATPQKKVLDFTNVSDGGSIRPKRLPEGDYRAKVVSVEDHKSKNDKEGWKFVISPIDYPRATYAYYTDFEVKNAWKIRALIVACGLNAPKKRLAVDPNRLVGKELGISLEDDEYEGKAKSTIDTVFPASDLATDSPKKSTKSSEEYDDDEDPDDDDPQDDEDDSDSEDDELDLDEV